MAASSEEVQALISQTLESKGVLGKLRAQLRAAVYTTVDEQERRDGIHLENKQLEELRGTPAAVTLYHLVDEYLSYFHLDFTQSCFRPETNGTDVDHPSRDDLATKLGMKGSAPGPLLLQLLDGGVDSGRLLAPAPVAPTPAVGGVVPGLVPPLRGPSPPGSTGAGTVSPRSTRSHDASPVPTPVPTPPLMPSPRLPDASALSLPSSSVAASTPFAPHAPVSSSPPLTPAASAASAPSTTAPPAPSSASSLSGLPPLPGSGGGGLASLGALPPVPPMGGRTGGGSGGGMNIGDALDAALSVAPAPVPAPASAAPPAPSTAPPPPSADDDGEPAEELEEELEVSEELDDDDYANDSYEEFSDD